MTDREQKVKEIRKRYEKASAGKWEVTVAGDHESGEVYEDHVRIMAWVEENLRKGKGPLYGVRINEPGCEEIARMVSITGNGPTSEANADFIAATCDDIPWLLFELDRRTLTEEEAERVADIAGKEGNKANRRDAYVMLGNFVLGGYERAVDDLLAIIARLTGKGES